MTTGNENINPIEKPGSKNEVKMDEVKQHTNRNSLWFVIHNKVYDVTKFLDDHPGGEEVLLEQGGKNATEIFEDVSHSADAKELMKKYLIGELPESERIVKNVKQQAEDRATKHFNDKEHSTSLTWTQWVITILVSAGGGLLVRYMSS